MDLSESFHLNGLSFNMFRSDSMNLFVHLTDTLTFKKLQGKRNFIQVIEKWKHDRFQGRKIKWKIKSRAFRLSLGVQLVSVARTFWLVSIGSRGHTLTLLAAESTILKTPVLHPCIQTSCPTFWITKTFQRKRKNNKSVILLDEWRVISSLLIVLILMVKHLSYLEHRLQGNQQWHVGGGRSSEPMKQEPNWENQTSSFSFCFKVSVLLTFHYFLSDIYRLSKWRTGMREREREILKLRTTTNPSSCTLEYQFFNMKQ